MKGTTKQAAIPTNYYILHREAINSQLDWHNIFLHTSIKHLFSSIGYSFGPFEHLSRLD